MKTTGWRAGLAALALLTATNVLATPAGNDATEATQQTRMPELPPDAVALTATDLDAWLDGYMPYALASGDIAGAVVVVVKDGQILTEKGYGYADAEKRLRVDPAKTLFRPGSISKLFTWTAVMQLVEQGKIDLDADINTYLDFRIPPRDGKPVTMRQMMQHVAGFEEQLKDLLSYSGNHPGFEAILKQWVPERVYAAGSTPAYSNYAAALAGYVVERISGEPFDDYMDKHIFTPLKMTRSTFRQPVPPSLAPLLSKGYELASDGAKPFEFVGPAPAGSLSSTGEDMAHFMLAHLQGGQYDGQRILQEATVRQMHDSPLTLLSPLNRMELGFFETNINGREVIAHLGDTQYFHSSLHLFTAEGVGLYVSFNSLGKDRAAGSLRSALFQDFADRYFPAPLQPATTVDAVTAARHAQLMLGTWVMSRRSQSNFLAATGLLDQVKVSLDAHGGIVFPVFPSVDGKPRRWVETAPFLWQDQNSHDRLAAHVENGKVTRWSFDMASPIIVFERPVWYRDSSWLTPVFALSLLAMLLTAVLWPVRALVRRHFSSPLGLAAGALRAYRASRIAALCAVVATLAWAGLIASMLGNFDKLSAATDGALLSAQIFGALVYVLAPLAMVWNLTMSWTRGRHWTARVWSVVLLLSSLGLLWAASVFHLIRFGVNY